jgi:hypothetical protein
VPYYSPYPSVTFGSFCLIYFWTAVNAILREVFTVIGHYTIIFVGIPFIVLLARNIRIKRLEMVFVATSEKMKDEIEALLQISTVLSLSQNPQPTAHEEMHFIGKYYQLFLIF